MNYNPEVTRQDYKVEFTVSDEHQAHVWTYELTPASLLEDFGRGIMSDIRFQVDSVFGPLTFTFKKVPTDTQASSVQMTLDDMDDDEEKAVSYLTVDDVGKDEDDEGYDEEDYDEDGEDDDYDTED